MPEYTFSAYWVMIHPTYGIPIFGGEITDTGNAQDDEVTRRARKDGFIFGHWASAPYPQGELGSHHISRCLEIDEVTYQLAKDQGWDVEVVFIPLAEIFA
jgi:hypothetical protein